MTNIGIKPQAIGFTTLTMESEKYICINELAPDGTSNVAIIDLEDDNRIIRRPISVYAAVMNPKEKALAFRGKKKNKKIKR